MGALLAQDRLALLGENYCFPTYFVEREQL